MRKAKSLGTDRRPESTAAAGKEGGTNIERPLQSSEQGHRTESSAPRGVTCGPPATAQGRRRPPRRPDKGRGPVAALTGASPPPQVPRHPATLTSCQGRSSPRH